MGQLREAEHDAKKSIEINSKIARGHYVLGCILEQRQEFESALKSFQNFLDLKHWDAGLNELAKKYMKELKQKGTADLI